jgi:integrase/recombinase XerD
LSVERGLAPNTLASYRRDLRRYVGFLDAQGVSDVASVKPGDVAEFLMQLREGDSEHPPLSSSSAARTIVAVRGLHKFVVREGLSDSDPAVAVKPPAPPKRLPKALPLAEVEKILDAAGTAGTVLAMRDRALLEVLYGTGARISEAVGLDVDDLDLDQGAVLLRGKGGKQRVVPVGSFAREAVGAYLVRARPELAATGKSRAAMFLNSRGGRLSRQSAWTVL